MTVLQPLTEWSPDCHTRAMSQERSMLGQLFRRFSILFPSLLIATLPMFAQVAPPPPQGYPAQGYPPRISAQGYPAQGYPAQGYPAQDPSAAGAAPQGAADGGDQGPAEAGPGVARISLLNGDVSVRRGDSGDYVAAAQNAPLMVQDSIQTGAGARSEIQFDASSMVRLAQNTEVHFTDLQPGRVQLQLGRGTITFRLLRDANAQVEIDTPSVSVRPARMGVYRITVTDDGQSYITPRVGQVEVFTPKGSQTVDPGQTMMARGPSSDPEFQLIAALNRDEWDAWSDSRDQGLQRAWANSSQYVPQGVYGTEDLAGHGQWVNTPDYGYAWAPAVGPDWSPYSVGRWAWEDYYGWTWVSYDPWGWAPYHYGRWFNRGGGLGWAWWPGRVGVGAFWSPALVGFFGFGPGFGGIGFGRIGWVPLAPFELFHPWYGRGGGFRSATVFNNTNIANIYRNARVGNGVMAMNSQQFGRGSTGYSRVSGNELRSASLLHGAVPVRPTSQSLRFTDRATSTVARTNFSQSRFASHMTPTANQRTPFGQQTAQRSIAGSSNTSVRGGQAAGSTGSTWNRYGGSAAQGSSAVPGARAFGSTPGTRNIPQSSSAPSVGWNRFGSTSGGAGSAGSSSYRGSSYGSTSGRSQLQISPPLVQPRGSNSAPRSNSSGYSAPSYSAPHYSAPAYNAPHYSAPSGSGGGGSSHPSSGGGGHSSSGGGSGHRR